MADSKRGMCGGDLDPVEGSTDAECNGKLSGPSAAIPGASGTKEENIRRLIARSAAAQRRFAAGDAITVGLRSDGTGVAVGNNEYGQCNVSGWTDIAAIVAGDQCTIGLKSDGTVVAVGDNEDGDCNVSDWKLFNSIDTLEQEIEEGHRAEERRKEELSDLSGPSADKRRKEIEERLSEIERELSQLK